MTTATFEREIVSTDDLGVDAFREAVEANFIADVMAAYRVAEARLAGRLPVPTPDHRSLVALGEVHRQALGRHLLSMLPADRPQF